MLQDKEANALLPKLESSQLPVSVYFDNTGNYILRCNLPTQDELSELKSCLVPTFSLTESIYNNAEAYQLRFRDPFLKLLKKAERFKDSPRYLNKVSNLAELAGQMDESMSFAKRAADASNYSSVYISRYVNALIHKGAYQSGEHFLLEHLEELDSLSYVQLAYVEIHKSQFENAQQYVDTALSIDPLSFEARLFAGTLAISKHNWELALRHYRVAAQENNKSSPLFVNMALAYWMLQQYEKAESCLKKSLLINPLNKNAITFYADLTKKLNKNQEPIPFLEFYLEFEQKDADIWGKLGDANFYAGKHSRDKSYFRAALEAFKLQHSLTPSCGTLNNIALANSHLGNYELARKYYSHAILNYKEHEKFESLVLTLYNYSILILDKSDGAGELSTVLLKFITGESRTKNIEGHYYDYLKLFLFIALARSNHESNAVEVAEHFLAEGIRSDEPRVDLLNRLLIHFSDMDPNESKASQITDELTAVISDRGRISEELRKSTINNVAFSHCRFNRLKIAQETLNLISGEIYKNPYPTATLGMIKVRKGLVESGEALYLKAIQLVQSEKERDRFKKRMNFELGSKLFELNDVKRSIHYLNRAIKFRVQNSHIDVEAKEILKKTEQLPAK